jgi:hypothetical protein
MSYRRTIGFVSIKEIVYKVNSANRYKLLKVKVTLQQAKKGPQGE